MSRGRPGSVESDLPLVGKCSVRDEQPAVSGTAGFGKMDNACGRAYFCFSFVGFRGHIWCRGDRTGNGNRVAHRAQVIHITESHYGLQLKVEEMWGRSFHTRKWRRLREKVREHGEGRC